MESEKAYNLRKETFLPGFRFQAGLGVGLEEVDVTSYSGRTYADRPISFYRQGKEFLISSIELEWLEPGNKFFRVLVEDENVYELCYNEAQDKWWLIRQESRR